MSVFFIGALLMSVLALVLVGFPWLVRTRKQGAVLTNKQVIRQRLEELQREEREGLISEQERISAEQELKLALLSEHRELPTSRHGVPARIWGIALLLVAVCSVVYFKANEITSLQRWESAIERLPELGKRIVFDADDSIQPSDLEDFALGIRSKLAKEPDDATGWLLLGRLYSSLNRLDSALEAFERSLSIAPDNLGALNSYGQALVMTGQEPYLNKAVGVLQQVIAQTPDDPSTIGLLAVTATQLGQDALALENWRRLKTFIPDGDPMHAQIDEQVAKLSEAQGPATKVKKSVEIEVVLDEALLGKLPEQGYLFVFAQDASGQIRMPAAVVKSPLQGFPVKIELSDANAMMADYTLSSLEEARLVARVSADENVSVKKGELQGEVVVTLQSGEASIQRILINKELM